MPVLLTIAPPRRYYWWYRVGAYFLALPVACLVFMFGWCFLEMTGLLGPTSGVGLVGNALWLEMRLWVIGAAILSCSGYYSLMVHSIESFHRPASMIRSTIRLAPLRFALALIATLVVIRPITLLNNGYVVLACLAFGSAGSVWFWLRFHNELRASFADKVGVTRYPDPTTTVPADTCEKWRRHQQKYGNEWDLPQCINDRQTLTLYARAAHHVAMVRKFSGIAAQIFFGAVFAWCFNSFMHASADDVKFKIIPVTIVLGVLIAAHEYQGSWKKYSRLEKKYRKRIDKL
ncbi:hypothetical protein [Williamsia sterculiae]|uniref:Uncharacterized protein n=1 Tax=Williamsia sterculiae TaxID=1344003 RepID=A0A1N7HAV0_9NOCA|nr:hypothetical protein [Williamsia sterculiae]SIS22009.1 hypothetical protein SAMN05445060_3866 [Williamsia sterculiae]